jgi:FkbM family methyltransferase
MMIAPKWKWLVDNPEADVFRSDIWGIAGHFFPGCRVLDIGANRGMVTAYCAVNGGIVTAYEPHPLAFESLLETIALNEIESRVTPINSAVWTFTGEIEIDFSKAGDYLNGTVSGISPRQKDPERNTLNQKTQCVSFEQAVGDTNWDIVKMDIEGAEYPILHNCPESVFDHIKFFTIELHDNRTDEIHQAVRAKLARHFVLEDGYGDWSIFGIHR